LERRYWDKVVDATIFLFQSSSSNRSPSCSFQGICSDGQLIQLGTDQLSLRWYLGDELAEPLPDHSRFARIRERSLTVFRGARSHLGDQTPGRASAYTVL
jgi:Transposase domain (DUF772)